MKTIALKMKMYASNVHIVDNDNLERRVLNFMLLSLGLLGLIYVLILGNMIFNIVQRKALEARAHTLQNEVADLELNYLGASNKVDLSLAQVMGFRETAVKFATRKALGSIKVLQNDL